MSSFVKRKDSGRRFIGPNRYVSFSIQIQIGIYKRAFSFYFIDRVSSTFKYSQIVSTYVPEQDDTT
jgi:hypothetical protein